MVYYLKYFCSIIAVICAVSSVSSAYDEDECSIGRVYNPDTQKHISNIPTGWYLNLDSPLSCSGRLSTLMVRFYQPLNSGHYCIPWALWKPLENGTYQRVSNSDGSYCQYFDEAADEDDPELYTHDTTIQSYQRHLVERGLVIGVYIRSYETLSVVTNSSRIFESSGVCRATSGVTNASSVINCTVYGSGRLNLLLNVDIIDCGQPSPPANGSVTYGSTQYGSVITYACYSGYTLNGSLNNTCSSAGSWTAPTPTCQQLKHCPNITINNGSMRANNSMGRGPFYTGTIVLFTCDVGFRLSGSPRLVCRPDATWDNNTPTCIPNKTVIPPPSVTGFNSSNTIIMSSTVKSSPSVIVFNSSNTIIMSSTFKSSSTSMATVFTTLLSSASRASVSSSSSFMATSNNVISQNTVSVSVSPSNSVIPIINEPIFTRTQLIILIVACGLFTSAITAIIALVIVIMCRTRRKEGRNVSNNVSYFVEGREDLIYSDVYRAPQQAIALEERPHHEYEEPQTDITRYEEPARGKEDLYVQLDRIKVKKILLSDIELKDYLGSGQFGFVHKGIWKGSLVAVKSLRNETTDIDRVKFLQEAAIMGQFSHSNIVKLYGLVNEGDDNIMLVVELMPAGDLQKYLPSLRNNQSKEGLAESLLTYCKEICSGMLYLSKRGFVHRDLAARNILLTATNQCKIADFGMSRDVELEGYYVAQRGTMIPIKWTAPEALKFRKYSSASDVWSYGCVLYEIWSLGLKPFEHSHNKEVLDKLDKGYRMPPPSGCPYLMYKLMILCWHPEPSQRPSFPEISRFLLEQSNESLLHLPEGDIGTHPKAKQLGSSDLYAGENMYKDLQNAYVYYSTLQHI